MTYKELRRNPKPRFYENHKLLLQQTLLEPQVLSMYLYENMLNFYQDVNDVADTFEIYSCLDGHYSTLEYQYGNM